MLLKSLIAAGMCMALLSCDNAAPTDPSDEAQADSLSNPVISTIMARRSVRKYQDRPVEREKLARIVECGINAPSAMNKQPWQLRVVDDPEYISGVTAVYVGADSAVTADPDFKNMFRNAPAVIFVASPADGSGQLDCGLLGENMMLAAQSLGLGTCCLGGPVRFLKAAPDAAPYVEKLGLPDDYTLLYAIAVGYPDEAPEARDRDASKARFVD
ncbi:MAG: nitroreductase family protein [Paramuribaculum sp.]|nr:nitroreductase family protein [Paramuribaculum sp.]